MTDSPALVPTAVRHYAAYLRAKATITPDICVRGRAAEVCISTGEKTLVLRFGCRKTKWSLHSIEIRGGEQTAHFTRGELTKAIAALLGQEPPAAAPQAINSASGARTDAALRQQRTTVIRV
jgi:hypothetical protein